MEMVGAGEGVGKAGLGAVGCRGGGREQGVRDTGSCPSWPLLHALQLEERAACSAKFGNSLQISRSEIADLNVRIQKLRSQILSIP